MVPTGVAGRLEIRLELSRMQKPMLPPREIFRIFSCIKHLYVYTYAHHISHSSVTSIKSMTKSNLRKKVFILAYGPREAESITVRKPRRHRVVAGSWMVTFHPHTGRWEMESRKWEEVYTRLQWLLPPERLPHKVLWPPQAVLPAGDGDQLFKCTSLGGGHFYFRASPLCIQNDKADWKICRIY